MSISRKSSGLKSYSSLSLSKSSAMILLPLKRISPVRWNCLYRGYPACARMHTVLKAYWYDYCVHAREVESCQSDRKLVYMLLSGLIKNVESKNNNCILTPALQASPITRNSLCAEWWLRTIKCHFRKKARILKLCLKQKSKEPMEGNQQSRQLLEGITK